MRSRDTQEEEKGTPRPPEAAVEGGQVRIGDEKLIGNAFVMMGLAGKTAVLLCEPKDVECWANLAMNGGIRKTLLKTGFFGPGFLRLSGWRSAIRKTVPFRTPRFGRQATGLSGGQIYCRL